MINKGRVVSEGTPTEIKRVSEARQIRCSTKLATDFLRTLPSVTSVMEDAGTITVTAHQAETVIREMLQRDEDLSNLEIASPALEDAFLALTKN